jgi:hypothetical protein
MAVQQGGNFKGSKHQRSKRKKTTGQKQDGGILPWLLFKGPSGGSRRRRRRRTPMYVPRYPPQRRQPRSMYISLNNTQFSRQPKMYNRQQERKPTYPLPLRQLVQTGLC